MIQKDALLIDELPAGSKLYFRSDNTVVIVGETNSESRQLYTISPQRNLKSRSCLVQKWSGETHQMINVELDGGIQSIPKNGNAIAILHELFPSLDDFTLAQLDGMGDHIAWELAACLEDHPRIHAAGYPINYLALILWQENGKEILDNLEQEGGIITTQHLCEAAGIDKLTPAMKDFIRMIKPSLCKHTHINRMRHALQQWDAFRAVFQHRDGKQLDTIQLDEICLCMDRYPMLARSKWFRAKELYNRFYYLNWEGWIQRAYDFYQDDMKARGKPLPAEASTIEKFLTQYIRSANQLHRLIWHAEEQLTERGEKWLEENYPDNYQFENVPAIADCNRFRLLRTAGQLREMAKKLRNCAAGYLHEAASGTVIFFAYEYSPENSMHPFPYDPEQPVDGLLALRRDRLDHWLQTGAAPDWIEIQQKLVVGFKGFRNTELGQHAWNDLESFFCFQIASRVLSH